MVAPDAADDASNTAALSAEQRARIALSLTARATAEYARELVPQAGDRYDGPGEPERRARRLRLHALAVVHATVLYDRTRGRTWEEIADGLGLSVAQVRADHERWTDCWIAGDPVGNGPALPRGAVAALMPQVPADVTLADVRALDDWYARTGPAPAQDPVTLLLGDDDRA